MFKFLLISAVTAIAVGQQFVRPLWSGPYPQNFLQFAPLPNNIQRTPFLRLCTYSDVSFQKCKHTISAARNNSIHLALKCVRQKDRESCINSVRSGNSDMIVLTGHGYKEARYAGLKPMIYAREDDRSLYIAVAPRNITFVGVQEAPIYFDQSKHRAFHAATFFNFLMGHNICSFLDKASLNEYITIVDSANYVPNDEEILICPNRVPGEFENYRHCNVEAGLQRAVFIKSNVVPQKELAVLNMFATILENFGPSSKYFNFFDTFEGQDDVIFKSNTISLDLEPTYRNKIDEDLFNYLHCNRDDQPHDPRVLQ